MGRRLFLIGNRSRVARFFAHLRGSLQEDQRGPLDGSENVNRQACQRSSTISRTDSTTCSRSFTVPS